MKQRLLVEGMMCATCVSHVEKATLKVKGVLKCQVSLLTNDMVVEYDGKNETLELIIASIAEAGYNASLPNDEIKLDETKEMRQRLYPSLVLMIILMYVAMSHMFNLPLLSFINPKTNPINFTLCQLLLTIPVVILNRYFYITGFKSLFVGKPNMNALVALGSSSALIYGIYSLLRMIILNDYSNTFNLYFESASMILTLITLGKYLEQKAKKKTTEAISSLINLVPKTAIVFKDNQEEIVLVKNIKLNDILVLKPGMMIPIDGIITEGYSSFDESALTGESIPVEKSIDDNVMSGSIILDGQVKIRATKVGDDSTINTIIKLVSEAASSKAKIAQLADKIANVFVPVVIIISIITFVIWIYIDHNFDFALKCAISVLVVSCPCALGLATPVSLMVANGRAAKGGIIFKNGEALELLSKVTTIVFDKTGTITENKPEVNEIIAFDDTDVLLIAASLEKNSTHPLSKAVLNKAENLILKNVEHFSYFPGKGIIGDIEGETYYLGNQRLLKDNKIDLEKKELKNYLDDDKTTLLLADKKDIIGLITIRDRIKDQAFEVIKKLQELNLEIILLSGDKKEVVNSTAQKVGIKQVYSEVLPQDKEKIIKQLQKDKKIVAMVGDGINDAIALSRANVGIAVKSGSDIAIDSADVVLMKDNLEDIFRAVKLSNNTLRIIKQNLFWAFFYNSLMIPLASGIFYKSFGLTLNPMIASACMSISSITVVSNALRLRNIKLEKKEKEIKNMKKELIIEGMMCQHCVKHVYDALNKIDGVQAEVSLEHNNAIITLSKEVSDEVLIKAVTEAGYVVKEIR